VAVSQVHRIKDAIVSRVIDRIITVARYLCHTAQFGKIRYSGCVKHLSSLSLSLSFSRSLARSHDS